MEYIFGILTENTESIFTIPVPLTEEYKPFFMDLARMISIQTMVNVMFYLSDPVKNSLFSFVYLKTLFFVLLGVSVYWLLFRNFLTFEYVGNTMFNDSEKVEAVEDAAAVAEML